MIKWEVYIHHCGKLFQNKKIKKSSTRKQNPGDSKCFSNKCEKESAAAVSITIYASRKKFLYQQNLGTDGAPFFILLFMQILNSEGFAVLFSPIFILLEA